MFLLSFKGPQSTCRWVSGKKQNQVVKGLFLFFFFFFFAGGDFNLTCAIPDAAKNNLAIYPHNLLVSLGCRSSLPPLAIHVLYLCVLHLDLGVVCTTSFMSIHYVL